MSTETYFYEYFMRAEWIIIIVMEISFDALDFRKMYD